MRLQTQSKCESVNILNSDEKTAFLKCKTRLAHRLQKKCSFSQVENPGILLYCKIRGNIDCCFRNIQILYIQSLFLTSSLKISTNTKRTRLLPYQVKATKLEFLSISNLTWDSTKTNLTRQQQGKQEQQEEKQEQRQEQQDQQQEKWEEQQEQQQ